MDANPVDDAPASSENAPATPEHRYAAISLLGTGAVIYDRENHDAWIQSDAAVALSEVV